MAQLKIKDLKLICIKNKTFMPPINGDRILISDNNKIKVHFINSDRQLRFQNLKEYGFVANNKIRYLKHDINPNYKFYVQLKTDKEFLNLSPEEQSTYYSLSNVSPNDTTAVCTSGKSFWKSMIPLKRTVIKSFDSDSIHAVQCDEGLIYEIDFYKSFLTFEMQMYVIPDLFKQLKLPEIEEIDEDQDEIETGSL